MTRAWFFSILAATLSVAPFSLWADEEKKDSPSLSMISKDGYTINYNTVSIVEYIRFASKVCNANFIFNEAELPFTVTVVSDAPITSENVMATLIQMLRIHGLMLLEQGNNLVIHKSGAVRQPATLVFDNEKNPTNAPIVTRVYRLKNANVDSVAAIVRPMISDGAIIEVSHETRQLILTDATMVVDKISALIENLDSPHTSLEIRNFESKYNKPEYLIELASQIMHPIAQGNPFILVPQSLANAVFIVSTPELNEKAFAVLTSLDTPPKKVVLSERKIKSENIFVIKLEHRPGDEVLRSLKDISNNLQESGILENDLLETIESAKWIRETNSLMFVGSPESHIKIKEFVTSLDVGGLFDGKASFFVYRPVNRGLEEVQKSMQELAENLAKTKGADDSLIATIRSQKANPVTNTILYSGDPAVFPKIKDLLLTIDTISGKGPSSMSHQNFFVYKIQTISSDQILASLKSFARSLEKSGLTDSNLVETIQNAKYIKETHSLVFVGPDDVLKRLQEIVPQFDAGLLSVPASTQFFAYKPQHLKGEVLVKLLKETLDNLKANLSDPALLHSLESMKWVKNTNTLLITGDPASLKRVEELIGTLDVSSSLKKDPSKGNYFVYKLQNPHVNVEEDLENLVSNMKSAGIKDTPVVKVLENMRYVKETESVLLTGDPVGIEEAKELVAKYDQPRVGGSSRNVFMFKPENVSASKVEKAVHEIKASLSHSGMADPGLLDVISSMKYIDSTRQFFFNGTPDAVAKMQAILKEIDTPTPQAINVGKSTFLFYKLKNAGASQITTSLKTITNDLKKSGATDVDFLNSLESMKYVKETNSLMFTGSEESLSKVQALVGQFDVGSARTTLKELALGAASDFFIYKPLSLSAQDLELTLQDFAENLKTGGLNDPGLFNTLHSMKYNEKTQSLVFTGDPKSLERVKQLLKEFDVPSNLAPGALADSSIQAIDNTNFLVYKLEFHKGDEIQNALRQIAKDLILTNATVNQNLLNAINSIQWLEVTNSLLCTGDQETLVRLKELIKNLDVPLKQVFIEVLVIQTNLTNSVAFGLEWGGKVQYKDQLTGTFNNFHPYSTGQTSFGEPSFENSLGNTRPDNPPNIQNTPIPFLPQFDLGVIGDVIKYNGKSFLSLGSLLNALESDQETTVVMTPKIIAQDSKQAKIFSGQNVPFAGSLVTNSTGQGTLQTANIEYRDVGFDLSITPVLGNSEIITMEISLDNSSQVSVSTGANFNFQNGSSASGITTSRTTMATTVHVPNKNFLILSGMVNNSNNRTKTGIPCLGGIPILGSAFSTNNDLSSNTNVVIFLRPTIINSLDEMKKLTSEQEEFFRNQAGTPALERNYDEGMELIKTPDDE